MLKEVEVSVVIPMFNAEDTIKKALDSVFEQSGSASIEVVVVNDGSTDNSALIVHKYINSASHGDRVCLVEHPNKGVSEARNTGIKAARGTWVAFLDSDDYWLPHKLERQLGTLKKNLDIKFLGTNRSGEVYPFFGKKKKQLFELSSKEILIKWYPQTSTVLIHKSVLNANLFDGSRTHGEDGDLWLRISAIVPLFVLNETLVITGHGKRHFGESGLSANLPLMFKGELQNLADAKVRNQVNRLEYGLFFLYFWLKYLRRVLITKLLNFIK